MATNTKKRRTPQADTAGPPAKKTQPSRPPPSSPASPEEQQQQQQQQESPTSPAPSPASSPQESFYRFEAPTLPQPTRWVCRSCGDVYPLAAPRCLDCGRRVRLRSPKTKTGSAAPGIFFDFDGWERWMVWRRWYLLGEANAPSARGTTATATATATAAGMSSIVLPYSEIEAIKRKLEALEEERVSRLETGRHNCAEDCDEPLQCKLFQLLGVCGGSSPMAEDKENQPPQPPSLIPDSPRSPPSSSDEDETPGLDSDDEMEF